MVGHCTVLVLNSIGFTKSFWLEIMFSLVIDPHHVICWEKIVLLSLGITHSFIIFSCLKSWILLHLVYSHFHEKCREVFCIHNEVHIPSRYQSHSSLGLSEKCIRLRKGTRNSLPFYSTLGIVIINCVLFSFKFIIQGNENLPIFPHLRFEDSLLPFIRDFKVMARVRCKLSG